MERLYMVVVNNPREHMALLALTPWESAAASVPG